MTNSTIEKVDPSRDEVRALVAGSNSKLLATVVDRMQTQAIAEVSQARQIVNLLSGQGAQWAKECSPTELMAFGRICVSLGLNPLVGQAYLVHGTFYVGIAGCRKLAADTKAMRGESAPRLLTENEKEVHGVREGDIARAVEVWREGWQTPALGVGIVRKGELAAALAARKGPDGLPFSPLGRNPEFMAAKRAAHAAYKIGFPELDAPVVDVAQVGQTYYADDLATGRPLAIEAGFVDDAPALTEEPAAAAHPPDNAAADKNDEASADQGAPLEPSSQPEPSPLPVTDVQSLIGWARDSFQKTPEEIATALEGKVPGDIAKQVRQHFGGDYAATAAALSERWGAAQPEGKLL